jgi:hypothetical protein
MIDTGASKISTAGWGQYLAYKRAVDTSATVNKSTAGAVNVQFGIGSTLSVGSLTIDSPVGAIEFHIVRADTPFLLCLSDIDNLQVYFNVGGRRVFSEISFILDKISEEPTS